MRSSGGVRRQSGKAAAAASTAAFTSFASASGTLPSVAPVAGLMTSCQFEEVEFVHCPPMKCGMRISETAVAHMGKTSAITKTEIPEGRPPVLQTLRNLSKVYRKRSPRETNFSQALLMQPGFYCKIAAK